MTALKVRKVGNSLGVILPKEILDRLAVGDGDSLELVETETGFKLVPVNDESDRLMAMAEEIMERRRDMLRALAK